MISAPMTWSVSVCRRMRNTAGWRVVTVAPGELVCRVGRPVSFWFGVVDGLLKMINDSALGVPITFTGIPSGGWFGEGTVLKGEIYRYNIQALRKSVVAGLPIDTFHWLLDHSIGFNRFVMNLSLIHISEPTRPY